LAQHLHCIGASGAGKSTFLEGLMARDLAEGSGFCFIDKHGDSAKRIDE
jgi:type IV secretory pathway VirB4 component